jgi:hypothetical protein
MGAQSLHADGHGPAFCLATPTLGANAWSSDTMAMSIGTEEGIAYMFREMIGYGITEDLQAILTFPLSPVIDPVPMGPNSRHAPMAGAFTDVEASLLWRFHRHEPGIGERFESALLCGASVPLEDKRGSLENTPSMHVAAVTGYVSRSIYAWIGAGYQEHWREAGDQIGGLPYVTAAFAWRPPMFRKDYPKPDWRIFVESLAEFPQRNQDNHRRLANSGGEKILIGPSLLGLYGHWGIEAAALFPVHQRLNGHQAEENFRVKLVFSYWF